MQMFSFCGRLSALSLSPSLCFIVDRVVVFVDVTLSTAPISYSRRSIISMVHWNAEIGIVNKLDLSVHFQNFSNVHTAFFQLIWIIKNMHNLLLIWALIFFFWKNRCVYGIPWKLVIRCKNRQYKKQFMFLEKKRVKPNRSVGERKIM